jgi:hypothetical protein
MHPYLRLELVLQDGPGSAGAGGLPSTILRRVFGKALIDRFCPFGKPLCEERPPGAARQLAPRELCHLAETCPYGVLFAASRTARPPYALYVPTAGADGSPARAEITLYGPAWRFYPWALATLEEALRHGLGKERRVWAIQEVRRVTADRGREPVAGPGLASLPSTLRPDLLGLRLEPHLGAQPVTVELLSPARLLRDGKLLPGAEPVPFEILIARILDRFASLYGEDGSDVLRPEIRSVVEAEAARVPLLADDTRWVEVHDFSARSRSEMLLGGKVGGLVYGGEAARFLPILWAGEILHLGKNAAAGCGRIQVDLPPPPRPSPHLSGHPAGRDKV